MHLAFATNQLVTHAICRQRLKACFDLGLQHLVLQSSNQLNFLCFIESAELEEYANVYSDLVKAVKPELILSSMFDNSALIHSYVAHNNKYLKVM